MSIKHLKNGNYINVSALIERKSFFNVGGFNLKDKYIRDGWYADWELFIRLVEVGYKGVLLKEPLIFIRRYKGQTTNETKKRRKMIVAIIKKNHGDFIN